MSRINEEYKKGFELGLHAKDKNEEFIELDVINMFRTDEEIRTHESETVLDTLNMFRSDEEKMARQKGYEAGLKERELRKRGIR